MTEVWTVLHSEVAYEGGWWRLRLDRCKTPADAVINAYPVLEYPDWVNIVALRREDRKVILTREYRHGSGQSVLALPGGTVERNEVLAGDQGRTAAARRELLEETGYLANDIRLIGTFLPNAATHSNRLISYLATDVSLHQDASIDDEAGTEIPLEFMAIDELVGLIRTGKALMESGHVAAIYAAANELRELA
ncbi:MAG: NUDIX hydrolase [Methylocystaceae bacterium]|nr:MAG: NUDIX hydrolase [Methylocystaceae bacterium]